jgi:hypothetical protein
MAIFSLSVPSTLHVPAGLNADATTFPTLGYAVKAVALAVQGQWVAYAHGSPLPNGAVVKTRDPAYSGSIQLRQSGDFQADVYSDLREAEFIEYGRPSRDMKEMLWTSAKVRISPKTGKRYLIIPFRHGTPGSVQIGNAMPAAVHAWWTNKAPSHVVGMGERQSGLLASDPVTRGPLMTPQRQYQWGDRLKKGDLAALGIHGAAGKNMVGMVNFRAPGKAGGASHSQFVSFRNMVEGSDGWIQKAKPGLYPAMHAAEELRPKAEAAFKKAVEEDMKRLFGS